MSFDEEIFIDRIATPGPSGSTITGPAFADVLSRLEALEAASAPQRAIASGLFYGPTTTLSGYEISGVTAPANYLQAAPFVCPQTAAFDQIGFNVTTKADTGGTMRMGIYNVGPDGMPSSRRVDLGTLVTTSTGSKVKSISLTLPRGFYWIAGAANNQQCGISHLSGAGMTTAVGQGGTSGLFPYSALARSLTSGFSSLPTSFGTPTAGMFVPAFSLRAV